MVVQLLLDASNFERSWRRLSKCLCNEEEFDEMKRTCAYCGMFEDEDDILVCCRDEYVCGTRASEKGESNMARSQEVADLTIQR